MRGSTIINHTALENLSSRFFEGAWFRVTINWRSTGSGKNISEHGLSGPGTYEKGAVPKRTTPEQGQAS
jgi:hypothetical protein